MQKLTQEIVDSVVKNNQKCTIYDDVVILYKTFDVTDDKIDDYISKISELKEQGINTPAILDYVKIKTSQYGYSKSVILEEKARGRNLEAKNFFLNYNEEIDFEKVALDYIKSFDDYLNEVELRANAPQEYYDKFASDYIRIFDNGLVIDPKPLNFYFSKEKGFTFIDINGGGKDDLEFFPRYILGASLGYGVPSLSIGTNTCNYIDNERLSRLKESYAQIINNVATSLSKFGYTKDSVFNSAINWTNQINKIVPIEDIADLSNVLSEQYASLKSEEEKRKVVNDEDWTIGW